ncbi:TenA family protein [Candidatus Puniceispirillum marinum]|uniref:Transcriptional activator, putative n=1 Tax=Puniceispirillum marinum (strain IMCC1322) TaxID=488538 RepID=D5BN20_PUNMI|nr:TenA family protein [Candidatus Puniceispirillum marinum]ADE40213.1 transcriptional activator, putative [Candidatus Puniceispirillum marinum IMCC1322]
MILGRGSKNGNDAPYYGRHFDQWRITCATQWHAFIQHKFFLSLADGSLPPKNFVYFLRQDYIFLLQFARAWGQITSKGSDISEIRMATAMMHQLINSKLQMHIELCNDEGIDTQKLFETTENPATTAYLKHFENVGASGDFIDLMAVLSPSFLGYAEIGSFLASLKTAPKYQRWITTYTDKNHQVSCHHIGRVIDDAIVQRLGADAMTTERWQTLCDRFRITTKLEVNFLDMSLSG